MRQRFWQHASQRWFLLTATIRVEWFATEGAARESERQAIRAEHPERNIQDRRAPEPSDPPVIAGLVTLKQAVERGHVGPRTTKNALKMAIWRDHQRPEAEQIAPWPVARDGKEDLFLADELTAFDASRR